jgi:hypothetical protein
VEELSMAVDNL